MNIEKQVSVFIGYFPKKTMKQNGLSKNPAVKEICSVSTCISEGPNDWINKWKHNDWWYYDTESIAMEVIEDSKNLYDIYAYKVLPIVFDGGIEKPIDVKTTAKENLGEYELLGYDVISRFTGNEFGCSPLSCNYGCDTYEVNRFCLIDRLDDVWRICKEIAKDSKEKNKWEPGPYYLIEVYRKLK